VTHRDIFVDKGRKLGYFKEQSSEQLASNSLGNKNPNAEGNGLKTAESTADATKPIPEKS